MGLGRAYSLFFGDTVVKAASDSLLKIIKNMEKQRNKLETQKLGVRKNKDF